MVETQQGDMLSGGSECQGTAVEGSMPAWGTACLRSHKDKQCRRDALQRLPRAGRTSVHSFILNASRELTWHCRVHIDSKEQRLLPQRPLTPVLQGLAALGHA